MTEDPFAKARLFTPLRSGDRCHVLRCIDGDSVMLGWFHTDGTAVKYRCRLRGIDCPESRSRNPDERRLAKLAKTTLEALVMGHEALISGPVGLDRYGRLLCDLTVRGESAIEHMLGHTDFCRSYSGGRREGV